MLIDLTKPHKQLLASEVGGKAFNLHKLSLMGLPVPPAVAVPTSLFGEIGADELKAHLHSHEVIKAGTNFAVRSSGVGEDGEGNSYAGIFESYLDVSPDEIHNAVAQVWKSVGNSRSVMYAHERAASIESMGVVVQHMINADYAGVAFSVCPIEKDSRIALIEAVAGSGDSLVSGTKTPATVRVNKLTGMARIQRHGADEISSATLENIAEILMPLIEKIEEEYGIAVDIEWAIAQNKPYILQARPITA